MPTRNGVRTQHQQSAQAWPASMRDTGGGFPWGLVLTGLVVGGLAYMAWKTLGPDLKRYLKIRSM